MQNTKKKKENEIKQQQKPTGTFYTLETSRKVMFSQSVNNPPASAWIVSTSRSLVLLASAGFEWFRWLVTAAASWVLVSPAYNVSSDLWNGPVVCEHDHNLSYKFKFRFWHCKSFLLSSYTPISSWKRNVLVLNGAALWMSGLYMQIIKSALTERDSCIQDFGQSGTAVQQLRDSGIITSRKHISSGGIITGATQAQIYSRVTSALQPLASSIRRPKHSNCSAESKFNFLLSLTLHISNKASFLQGQRCHISAADSE